MESFQWPRYGLSHQWLRGMNMILKTWKWEFLKFWWKHFPDVACLIHVEFREKAMHAQCLCRRQRACNEGNAYIGDHQAIKSRLGSSSSKGGGCFWIPDFRFCWASDMLQVSMGGEKNCEVMWFWHDLYGVVNSMAGLNRHLLFLCLCFGDTWPEVRPTVVFLESRYICLCFAMCSPILQCVLLVCPRRDGIMTPATNSGNRLKWWS